MKTLPHHLLALAVLAGLAAANDDFENGVNAAGWTFGPPPVLEPTGGNPGAWLSVAGIDTFAPILRNDPAIDSPFNGDYRAMNVTRITIDARTDFASSTAEGREFSLLLRDTKGTDALDDDDFAYYVGPLVPQPGQGWVSFAFDVPSASTDAVPPGWKGGWVGDPENFRPGVEWSDVIQSVDQVEFWWLNPAFFAILQQWDVGVDNVFIEKRDPIGTNLCGPAVPNSSGQSGVIAAFGSDVAADNDVRLEASQLAQDQFGYFLNSMTTGLSNPPGSQGNLCLGGAIGRYSSNVLQTGATGAMTLQLDLTQTPTPGGKVAIQAGQTWYFQAWFRDKNPTTTSNFG